MWLVEFWKSNGTKLLGAMQTIVAGLITIQGLIPPAHIPYWSAANIIFGAFTIHRGFVNSRNES